VRDARGLVRLRQLAPGPGATDVFGYDGLGRLVSATYGVSAPPPPDVRAQPEADRYLAGLVTSGGPEAEAFALDRADGRRRADHRLGLETTVRTAVLNDRLQLLHETLARPGFTSQSSFTYDSDGRRTADGRFRYRYDAAGRLARVESADGSTLLVELSWDPAGRLAAIAESGGRRRLTYLGGNLLEEDDPAGGLVHQYTQGLSAEDLVLRIGGDSGQVWCHADLLGSVVAVTDERGEVVERVRFRAFGEASVWAPDGVTPRAGSAIGLLPRFAQHSQLAAGLDGVYLTPARIYDAATGRFLSPDPVVDVEAPESGDPYAYVQHSPISFVDPTGQGRLRAMYEGFRDATRGATKAVANIFVEGYRNAVDLTQLAGYYVAYKMASPELRPYLEQPRMVGAVGKSAESGMGSLDIMTAMARNLVAAPGNALRAAQRGDMERAAEQAMNFTLGVSSVGGLLRGAGRFVLNRGPALAARFGPRGERFRNYVREKWQVPALERQLARIAEKSGLPPPARLRYDPTMARKDFGRYKEATQESPATAYIGERAFTPGLGNPVVGHVRGNSNIIGGLRLRVGNRLRGNLPLRTGVHEAITHHTQALRHPYLFERSNRIPSEGSKPTEFTLKQVVWGYFMKDRSDTSRFIQVPPPPFRGAWNVEMGVRAGPVAMGLAGSGVGSNLLDPKGGR
jgi:RHS repeat-associated protein